MDATFTTTVLMLCLYRIMSLLVGMGFAYLGYRLFYHGVFDKAGELQATWGEKRLLLKQAAPGTFFSLFGTIIVLVTLWKGIALDILLNGDRQRIWGATYTSIDDAESVDERIGTDDSSAGTAGSSVVQPSFGGRLKADLAPMD